uniref:Uncharacterized protein n=1 Tax=Arundo donax TaxID=35708 RepID=A0A0A8YWX1_ARUDO
MEHPSSSSCCFKAPRHHLVS